MARKTSQPGFEERLKQLEGIVGQLEGGNLPLEESLDLFEKGITLSRELQKALESASLRVAKLLENGEEVPFDENRPADPLDAGDTGEDHGPNWGDNGASK